MVNGRQNIIKLQRYEEGLQNLAAKSVNCFEHKQENIAAIFLFAIFYKLAQFCLRLTGYGPNYAQILTSRISHDLLQFQETGNKRIFV